MTYYYIPIIIVSGLAQTWTTSFLCLYRSWYSISHLFGVVALNHLLMLNLFLLLHVILGWHIRYEVHGDLVDVGAGLLLDGNLFTVHIICNNVIVSLFFRSSWHVLAIFFAVLVHHITI